MYREKSWLDGYYIDNHKRFECSDCDKAFIVGEKLLEDCPPGYPVCPYCGKSNIDCMAWTEDDELEELASEMGCLAIYMYDKNESKQQMPERENMERLEQEVKEIVTAELQRANNKFPLFSSGHEGFAVILEELEETEEAIQVLRNQINLLWEKIRGINGYSLNLPKVIIPGDSYGTGKAYDAAVNVACEAIQTAAMILKHEASRKELEHKED